MSDAIAPSTDPLEDVMDGEMEEIDLQSSSPPAEEISAPSDEETAPEVEEPAPAPEEPAPQDQPAELESTEAPEQETLDLMKQLRKSKQPEEELSIMTRLAEIGGASARTKGEVIRGVPIFVTILRKGSLSIQKTSLRVLHIAGSHADAKKSFRTAGGMEEMVRCLKGGGDLRQLALNVLGFIISREEANVEEFFKQKGIPALLDCMSDDDKQTRFLAAACCWVFASFIDHQVPLIEAGVVQKILRLITDDSNIAWQAMGTLRNLVVKNTQVHGLLAEHGGLEAFRTVLSDQSLDSEKTRQLIAQTLHVITGCNNEYRDRLRDMEMFPLLLDQLRVSENADYQTSVFRLWVNVLAKNQTNQSAFRELDGITLCFDFLSAKPSHPEEVRAVCATTLWAATVNNQESVDSLSQENISFLAQSLMLEPEKVLVGYVATISNIAGLSENGQNLIREQNMIPMILDFLRGNHPPLLEATGGTIMALCKRNDVNTEQVLACDGALLLARNLSSPNSGVKQNVAGALRIFLETNFGVAYKAIREVEGVVSLLAMLKEVNRPQLQSNAAYCILLLCTRSSLARARIVTLQGQYAISAAFQTDNEKVLAVMCETVACMAEYSEPFRAALGVEDVVSKVSTLVRDGEPTYNNAALRALWALCLNNEDHQVICRASGMIEYLVERLLAHDTTTQQKPLLLKALSSICGGNYKNQEVVRLKGTTMQALIGNLLLCLTDPDTNRYLAEPTALLLWCLARGNGRMQTSIREARGIEPLVEMIQQNPENPAILLNAAGALTEICRRCRPNRNIVKDTELINWLGGLEEHENQPVAEQARELRSVLNPSIF